MLDLIVLATLRAVAWVALVAGLVLSVLGIIGMVAVPRSSAPLDFLGAMLISVGPIFAGLFLWAFLLALSSITESLLQLREK